MGVSTSAGFHNRTLFHASSVIITEPPFLLWEPLGEDVFLGLGMGMGQGKDPGCGAGCGPG